MIDVRKSVRYNVKNIDFPILYKLRKIPKKLSGEKIRKA